MFFLGRQLRKRFTLPIELFDAAGLSLFCVTDATKSLDYGLAPLRPSSWAPSPPSAAGRSGMSWSGGSTVLTSGLCAIPALIGAAIAVTAVRTGVYGLPAALEAAAACFLIRLAGIRYNLHDPHRTRGQDQDQTKE